MPIYRWLIAAGASTILGVGLALQSLYPATPIAVAVFLLALMASNLATHRGLTVLIATIATAILLRPFKSQLYTWVMEPSAVSMPPDLVIALGAIWTCTALLVWDPRRRSLTVDALNHAFATAPTGMVIVTIKGQIVRTNDTFRDLIGSRDEDLSGQPLASLPCGDLWRNIEERAEDLAKGHSLRLGCELTRPDGASVFASGYVRRLTNASNDPSHYVVQLLDLSEAVDRERALTSAENRFEQLCEHSHDLILTIDANGAVTSVNPQACSIYEQSAESIIGTEAISLVHGDDTFLLEEALKRAQAHPGKPHRISQLRLNTSTATVIDAQFITLADFDGTVLTGHEITEQLTTMNRVRASEARFSRIFHASPDAILIARKSDGTVLDFNHGFTNLLGYTREQAIGTQNLLPKVWVDSNDYQRFYAALDEDGDSTQGVTKLVTAQNRELHVELSLRHIEIDNELCVMSICRDITEQVMAQEALRDSQAKFARVFTHSPDGIVILRQRDGTVLDINEAMATAAGYRRSELLDRRLADLPIFANSDQAHDVEKLLSQEGSQANLEISFRAKSGVEVPVLMSATSMELGSEQCTLCIARDVREQRKTEERLRESEERFRGTFENAPIGILLADTDGRIFHANLFAAELLAYRQDKLPGTHLAKLVPEEDRIYLKESLDRLIHGVESTSRAERRMVCNDGTEIWTNFHVVAQRASEDHSTYLIVQIADITEMKNSQKRMERLAFYDTLTNLANRTLFHERLLHAIDHAQRRNSCAALMYLDLDQFKRVNDTLGHEAGDKLLREVATRLKECVRKEDTVGRNGGDEFTVLLYDIKTPNDAGNVAEKILQRLRMPIDLNGHPLVVTTSIGITIIPNDGTVPNELMKNADLAMYRAKERGRNNFQFYSDEMNSNATNRLRMEYEIRSALENNEFELYYQPKVRMTDQRIVGMECLIRWDHPTRGLIGPHEFIEVAEETGAIIDIGSWVIRAACEAGRALSEINGMPIYTAVNISPRQFRDPNLVQTIQRALRQTKLNPNFLELEITETMLMQDIDVALATLNRLADLGLRFAIDDFGTGYSSLNYLKKFPINTVKVDRSFIMDIPHNPDDMEISAAVIAMAHRLNMEVVAEGVETEEQLRFLQRQQCDYGQGYLFAKPVPYDAFRALLAPERAQQSLRSAG